MAILDSQGRPVKIVSNTIRRDYDTRGVGIGPSKSDVGIGNTMMSRFAGNNSSDLKKFKRLAADIETANPAIRSPLLNQSNFYMPESDSSTGEPNRLLNQWILYYYKWNALCGNLISMHSELPLSRFALRGVDDPQILSFYEDMVESAELHLKMVELLRQYFMFGEVIPFAFWSDNYNCFTDLTFLDPNYVYVKGHYLLHSEEGDDVEFYELEPDPLLINLVKSDDYVNQTLKAYLNDDFIAAVQQNKRLLLSNFSTYMIRNRARWSDLRGTAILLRALKSLLYGDKLRESQYSVADGHVNPKWIWKLGINGDLSSGGYMPTSEDLADFRDLLVEANNDPIFTIITHHGVNVDAVGLNGKLLPLKQEYDQIEKDVMIALFSNAAMTTGQGPNFATASIAFRTMMSRYIPIRAKVDRYLYQKIFAPVAYANKFYKRKQADLNHGVRTGDSESNQLIIPTIDWRSKANLLDDGSVKSIISSMVSSGKMPMKILCEALDLDYSEVRNYLYSEQGTIFDSVTQEARKRISGTVADETMMGQPFAPKTNQPVPVKAQTGTGAEPNTKKAAGKQSLADKKKRLLSLEPLIATKDPIQTEINKGAPEVGGNPEIPDPNKEALKIEPIKAGSVNTDEGALDNQKNRVFDTKLDTSNKKYLKESVIKKKYDNRIVASENTLTTTIPEKDNDEDN